MRIRELLAVEQTVPLCDCNAKHAGRGVAGRCACALRPLSLDPALLPLCVWPTTTLERLHRDLVRCLRLLLHDLAPTIHALLGRPMSRFVVLRCAPQTFGARPRAGGGHGIPRLCATAPRGERSGASRCRRHARHRAAAEAQNEEGICSAQQRSCMMRPESSLPPRRRRTSRLVLSADAGRSERCARAAAPASRRCDRQETPQEWGKGRAWVGVFGRAAACSARTRLQLHLRAARLPAARGVRGTSPAAACDVRRAAWREMRCLGGQAKRISLAPVRRLLLCALAERHSHRCPGMGRAAEEQRHPAPGTERSRVRQAGAASPREGPECAKHAFLAPAAGSARGERGDRSRPRSCAAEARGAADHHSRAAQHAGAVPPCLAALTRKPPSRRPAGAERECSVRASCFALRVLLACPRAPAAAPCAARQGRRLKDAATRPAAARCTLLLCTLTLTLTPPHSSSSLAPHTRRAACSSLPPGPASPCPAIP
jgi:hypothetical protein